MRIRSQHWGWMSKICFSAANVATLVFVFALIVIGTRPAHAQTLTTLYSFSGAPDGGIPYSGLIRDGAGNLYGTTEIGGLSDVGTVFKIDSYVAHGSKVALCERL